MRVSVNFVLVNEHLQAPKMKCKANTCLNKDFQNYKRKDAESVELSWKKPPRNLRKK